MRRAAKLVRDRSGLSFELAFWEGMEDVDPEILDVQIVLKGMGYRPMAFTFRNTERTCLAPTIDVFLTQHELVQPQLCDVWRSRRNVPAGNPLADIHPRVTQDE